MPGPIPRAIWEKILLFIAARASGEITLYVERGVIKKCGLREVVKTSDDMLDCT